MQSKRNLLACLAIASMASPTAFAARMCPNNPSPGTNGAGTTGIIVKFRDQAQLRARGFVGAGLENSAQDVVRGLRISHPRLGGALRRTGVGADVLRMARDTSAQEYSALLAELRADPRVEYAEPDRHFRLAVKGPVTVPDPLTSQQWHFGNGAGGIDIQSGWWASDPEMGMVKTRGAGAIVAVIDTGLASHPDLDANVVAGYDFVGADMSRDGDGRDADASDPGDWTMVYDGVKCGNVLKRSSWHGTHVAGIVAALSGNGVGVFSTAPLAKVMPIRVFGVLEYEDGTSEAWALESDITDAIIWASGGNVAGVPRLLPGAEADVINLSLSVGGTCSASMQSAIDFAVSNGTTVVAAAGNNGSTAMVAPAICNNVVAVAATDQSGARASFSSYGAAIDVAAPGVAILSTLNAGNKEPGAPSYGVLDGTSMASPQVAGLVAILQAYRSRSPQAVEQLLKASARALPGACPGGCGAGIINPGAAVSLAYP